MKGSKYLGKGFYHFWCLLIPSTWTEQLPQPFPLKLLHPHSALIAPFPLQLSFTGENEEAFFSCRWCKFSKEKYVNFPAACCGKLWNVWHAPVLLSCGLARLEKLADVRYVKFALVCQEISDLPITFQASAIQILQSWCVWDSVVNLPNNTKCHPFFLKIGFPREKIILDYCLGWEETRYSRWKNSKREVNVTERGLREIFV